MIESYKHKLAELDDLLNGTNVPLRPALIWQLAEEISGHFGHSANEDRETQPVVAE